MQELTLAHHIEFSSLLFLFQETFLSTIASEQSQGTQWSWADVSLSKATRKERRQTIKDDFLTLPNGIK